MLKRPLRVLQVLGRANRGGAETWLLHVLRHVDRNLVAIDFAVHSPEPGAYDAEIRKCGARVFVCAGHRNLWHQFLALSRLQRTRGPYDVVHSHVDYYGGFVVLFARLLGVRGRIANFHSDTREIERSAGVCRLGYIRLMKRFIKWFATGGLGVSDGAAAALFGEKWRSDPRWRIHAGCVDLQGFRDYRKGDPIRTELGIPSDAIVFGHVGRFVEEKNHDFLICVAEALMAREPRSRFVLVGGGPTEEHTKTAVRERGLLDRFMLLPPRDDIARLMLGAFDYFLFPSRYEGLGLALVEAQAAGLRCFASTAVPPEAVVIPSLVRQLPLSAGPEYWAEAILRQLATPSHVTREEALRTVGESFDIRRNAAQLVEFYQTEAS
jgi:glycosyltransferase involved in cell wall biosynthesis